MGNTVKKIGKEAFYGCNSLENMTFSDNLEEIGVGAFANGDYGQYFGYIPAVEKIPVEGGVKYIGKVAYEHISGTDLNIKEGTVSLADNFINTYIGINSITLPSTLRILGNYSLDGASISSVELPESLERIGYRAFAGGTDGLGSSKLKRITIPKNVKYIYNEAFRGTPLVRVSYNAVNAKSIYYDYGNGREEEYQSWQGTDIFPESVTRVIIGEGVKSIPFGLFMDCKNIARVEMPSTVERIGDNAFRNCTSLTTIDLPSGLQYLGAYSLACGNLETVTTYQTKPMPLITLPDEEQVKSERDWEPGKQSLVYGYSADSPFSEFRFACYIDAEGNVTFGTPHGDLWRDADFYVEEGKYEYSGNPVPLLKVPNGSLTDYQSDGEWSVLFQAIQQFDGASSADVVEETTTVSVGQTVTEETDLTSTMMGSVLVTLDTEDSGDGYNATEGCLVINSTVSDEQLEAATADNADDLTVKNQFNGLIFEVPAGSGSVVIDCQTLGQNVVYVKIGSSEPKQVETAGRSQVSVAYSVTEPTRIYVYAAPKNAAAARQESDQLQRAPRRAAYANDDAVKLYGLTINVDENLSGIEAIAHDEQQTEGVWYTVDGRKLSGQPTKAGIYVRNGRKLVIK